MASRQGVAVFENTADAIFENTADAITSAIAQLRDIAQSR